MRYAYIKYGDAAQELKKIGLSPRDVPKSGPMTFSTSFLSIAALNPALMISWDNQGKSDSYHRIGAVEAYTYLRPRGLRKFTAGVKIFFQLLRFKPTVVVCVHDGPGLWASYSACRLLKAKLIHSRQRALKVIGESWHRRITRYIDEWVICRSEGVICHGPFTRQQLIEIGVSIDKIIEFDIDFDEAITSSIDLPGNIENFSNTAKNQILFVGRVEASKGVFELLKAAIPIIRERNWVDLIYIGEGNASGSLAREVEHKGLAHRIRFKGKIPHKEVYRQLLAGTVLVTPTRRGLEGRCMVALEGLAMGVPVVAPDAGPFPYMIKPGVNGLLYKDGSVNSLREKITQVIDDPVYRGALAKGAIEMSATRKAQNIKTFDEALSFAFTQWGDDVSR